MILSIFSLLLIDMVESSIRRKKVINLLSSTAEQQFLENNINIRCRAKTIFDDNRYDEIVKEKDI